MVAHEDRFLLVVMVITACLQCGISTYMHECVVCC